MVRGVSTAACATAPAETNASEKMRMRGISLVSTVNPWISILKKYLNARRERSIASKLGLTPPGGLGCNKGSNFIILLVSATVVYVFQRDGNDGVIRENKKPGRNNPVGLFVEFSELSVPESTGPSRACQPEPRDYPP